MAKEGKHIRLTLENGKGKALEAVGFGMGERLAELTDVPRIDLLGELSVNEWNGSRKLQVMLTDFRSNRFLLVDRRHEASDPGSLIEQLRASSSGKIRIWMEGAEVDQPSDTAATQEPLANEAHPQSPRRAVPATLALFGLPSNTVQLESLKQMLVMSGDDAIGRVILYQSQRDSEAVTTETGVLPDRKHFAHVYALCKEHNSWLDVPDGIPRQIADRLDLRTLKYA